MSFASFYNGLEKKYRFFGEGPFSALTSWLGEVIVRMDEPPVKKPDTAQALTAFYEAHLNEALAIEDTEKKYLALNEIKNDIEKRCEKNTRFFEKIDAITTFCISSPLAPVILLGAAVVACAVGLYVGAATVYAYAVAAVVISTVLAGAAAEQKKDKFTSWALEKFGSKAMAESVALSGPLTKVSQELAPIEDAKAKAEAETAKKIVEVKSLMLTNGGIEIYTDKTVQVKPAAAFPAEISKDFNARSYPNGAKVQQLADGSFVVYTDGVVKVKPAAAPK